MKTSTAILLPLAVADAFVPRNADMSATEPMWLGRDVTYEPAFFLGKLAELRVFDTALPCSSP